MYGLLCSIMLTDYLFKVFCCKSKVKIIDDKNYMENIVKVNDIIERQDLQDEI